MLMDGLSCDLLEGSILEDNMKIKKPTLLG